MKEKTAKKSKKPNEIMVLVPPMQPVDAMSNDEKVAALIALQSTPGWQIVQQVLEENRTWLQNILVDGFDPEDGKKLTPEQQDEIRYKIKLNRDVMKTPQGYIDALKRSVEEKVEYDPYYQSKSDIM